MYSGNNLDDQTTYFFIIYIQEKNQTNHEERLRVVKNMLMILLQKNLAWIWNLGLPE